MSLNKNKQNASLNDKNLLIENIMIIDVNLFYNKKILRKMQKSSKIGKTAF